MQFASAMSGLFGCQSDINILPISDYWAKLVESYCKKFKPNLIFTISNQRSFYHFTGRLLASFIYEICELDCHFNALGANIWVHQWEAENNNFIFRCFHGLKMVNKPITYILTPGSQEGAKALSAGEGKMEKGKNQKDIIKLTNFDNIVCPYDKDVTFPTIHASDSCGINFSNYNKAKQAFMHNIEWTAAMFPKANRSELESKIILVTKCFCNFGNELPQVGRQLCKMTAYEIPGAADLDEEVCNNPMQKATAKFRNTFVFQCCNPITSKRTKQDNHKHCDFKLSLIDVRLAMIVSKEIWSKTKEMIPEFELNDAKIKLPMFSFDSRKHCFKNAIVVEYEIDNDESDPFC